MKYVYDNHQFNIFYDRIAPQLAPHMESPEPFDFLATIGEASIAERGNARTMTDAFLISAVLLLLGEGGVSEKPNIPNIGSFLRVCSLIFLLTWT